MLKDRRYDWRIMCFRFALAARGASCRFCLARGDFRLLESVVVETLCKNREEKTSKDEDEPIESQTDGCR